jgi:hypothetical protein
MLGAHILHVADQTLNLCADILIEIFLGDNGWLGVGDGIDPDQVIITATGMDRPGTAFAVQRSHVITYPFGGAGDAE